MPRRSRRCGVSVGRPTCVRFGRVSGEKPQQRNAANARERARMRVLSKAFCRLKTTLPWVPPDTKLSKLDTLRLATSYIAHLRNLVGGNGADSENGDVDNLVADTPHPTTLTWPYSFPRAVVSGGQRHLEVTTCQDEEEDEDDWSQCSGSRDSSPLHPHNNHQSFLTHFTDVLMDIS